MASLDRTDRRRVENEFKREDWETDDFQVGGSMSLEAGDMRTLVRASSENSVDLIR